MFISSMCATISKMIFLSNKIKKTSIYAYIPQKYEQTKANIGRDWKACY